MRFQLKMLALYTVIIALSSTLLSHICACEINCDTTSDHHSILGFILLSDLISLDFFPSYIKSKVYSFGAFKLHFVLRIKKEKKVSEKVIQNTTVGLGID